MCHGKKTAKKRSHISNIVIIELHCGDAGAGDGYYLLEATFVEAHDEVRHPR